MVLKSDVAHHWPFSLAQASGKTPVTTYQSGAPGRPTSMHLVEVEFRARWDRGEAKTSIGAEARMLSEWLQKEHPDAPQLTARDSRSEGSCGHRFDFLFPRASLVQRDERLQQERATLGHRHATREPVATRLARARYPGLEIVREEGL